VNEFAVLVKNKIQERQECQCEYIDVSERANKLIDNIVNALDVTKEKILNFKSMGREKIVFG